MGKKLRKRYYAVKVGRKPGIYKTWDECKAQVNHFPKNDFKGFDRYEDAYDYIHPPKVDTFNYEVKAYVDGTHDGKSDMAGYAAVLLYNDFKYIIQGKVPTDSNQIAGETTAAIKAIEKAVEIGAKSIQIYYDYMGIEMWATSSWKANKDVSKAYVEFINSVKDAIKIGFVKVKSHSKNILNDEADMYAKQAFNRNEVYSCIKVK